MQRAELGMERKGRRSLAFEGRIAPATAQIEYARFRSTRASPDNLVFFATIV